MRNLINGYFLLFSLFILFSCDKEEKNQVEELPGRTLLIYLGRDNDLSRLDEEKIEPILQGWNGKSGKVIIYEDTSGAFPRLVELYREDGENRLKTIYQLEEEENSASGEVLNRVIQETVKFYPASSYGLVIFSHGWGWLPPGGFTSPSSRSILKDTNTEMNIREFAEAIPDNLFDFIVFEACYMASVEVAYELKDKTNYIVASAAEIVSPGFRDVYVTAINSLLEKDADLVTFAQTAFEVFNAAYGGTISVIKTSGLSKLVEYLKVNLDSEEVEDLGDIQNFDRNNNKFFFDFQDYYSRLISPDSVQEFSSLVTDCILYERASKEFMIRYNGFYIEKHSGLTSYIVQEQYDYLNEEYGKLKWFAALYH